MAGGKHITKPCQWRNQHAEESQDQVVLASPESFTAPASRGNGASRRSSPLALLLNLQSEPRQAELTP